MLSKMPYKCLKTYDIYNPHITTPLLQRFNLFRLASFNVQRIHINRFHHLFPIAKYMDVLFLQEFKGTLSNIASMQELCSHLLQFFCPAPSSDGMYNLTGIFVNLRHFSIISTFDITQQLPEKRYCSDICVRCNKTKQLFLFINLYLPTQNKPLQALILQSLQSPISTFRDQYPSIQIIFGGDMNHSMESNTPQEYSCRSAVLALAAGFDLQDISAYHTDIGNTPTNINHHSCRRLDRIYMPSGWRNRATKYSMGSVELVTSSHFLIEIEFVLTLNTMITLDPKRFQYPIHRLSRIFNPKRVAPFSSHNTLEEAFALLKNEGLSYIKLMRYLRRHQPAHMELLLRESRAKSPRGYFLEPSLQFLAKKTADEVVFQSLTDSVTNSTGLTTSSMISIATNYYKSLYSTPVATFSPEELSDYLAPVQGRLSVPDAHALDSPFTNMELDKALKQCKNNSAPGLDGIQFFVIRFYWDQFRPLLRRVANTLLMHGHMPDSLRKVLITLIPKKDHGTSTDIKNLRPILLTSCCLRVICKAANNRLMTVSDKLIGPMQRGFMTHRRMDQNIMEARTLIDLMAKEYSLLHNPDPASALLMADFTKAFDRISHPYLDAVLTAMGVGPNMRRFLMSITTQQQACVILNRPIGPEFPLSSGVRQGNPVSPMLFNIALEPLLYRLQQGLRGIPVVYEKFPITTLKYHAYADDVNIYLGTQTDYDTTATELACYSRFSNSKVSTEKSILYGFLPTYDLRIQNPLPFPRQCLLAHDYSVKADVTYLGIPYAGINWEHYLPRLPYLCKTNAFRLVQLWIRALGVNVYAYSRLPFRDLHTPLPLTKKLSQTLLAIFPDISSPKLFTRPHNGGLGLIDPEIQLQGHRAKVLFHILQDSTSWYSQYFRLKILHHWAKLLSPEASPYHAFLLNWDVVLFASSGQFFINLQHTFSYAECQYLWAWRAIAPRTLSSSRGTLCPRVTTEALRSRIIAAANLPADVQEWLHPGTFQSLSRKSHLADPPVRPQHFLELHPLDESHWRKFWTALYRLERTCGVNLDAFRRFNYGSFVPVHNSRYPGHTTCPLCLQIFDVKQALKHLYNECSCTADWWTRLGLTEQMNLRFMLAPLPPDPEGYRSLDLFVRLVRIEYRRRQGLSSTQELQPYSNSEFQFAIHLLR